MIELKEYVDGLFQNQPLTPEVKDLKEEILSNMLAKREDLIAQGLDVESATEKTKKSMLTVDSLIDGNQLTDIEMYHLECARALFLNCIIFWLFSLPLLFTCYALFSYIGLMIVIASGCVYISQKGKNVKHIAFLSIKVSEQRKRTTWIIWGLFFFVVIGIMIVLTFGSDLWFGRPLNINGPYQMANTAVRFYLPLLTIIIPITISNFSKILLKNRKGHEDE